jgi:hypothetical protein
MSNSKRTSYAFSTGTFEDRHNTYDTFHYDIRQGGFGNNGGAKIAGVTDGTSNSLAFGEAVGGRRKTASQYGPW